MTSQYFAYRIFLNIQQGEFPFFSKEEAFVKVFEDLAVEKKNTFNDWGNEHVIYYIKKLGENIHILQLGRRHIYEKPVPGDEKIEEIEDVDYPYIYVAFHVNRQIVLIQKDTTVFQKLDAVKAKLERFFTDKMNTWVNANFLAISDQRDFWAKIEEFDIVEKVEFDYEPPNFFRGKNVVDKLVREVHEETNYMKFKIFLQNKYNGLKFEYGTFKEHIQRLSSGAGNYVVSGVKNGVDRVLKSFKVPFKKEIHNIEDESLESLESSFEEIDELNKNENS